MTFAAHLDFGTATYGATVERDTSIDTAPAAAKVTAALTGGQPFFAVVLTAYTVKTEPVPASKIPAGYKGPPLTEEVRTATGTSDGTTPLHVAKGQSLTVAVTMTVPARAVTPGPSNATLTIHSAAWGTETIEITADYLSVDESTPIGARPSSCGSHSEAKFTVVVGGAEPVNETETLVAYGRAATNARRHSSAMRIEFSTRTCCSPRRRSRALGPTPGPNVPTSSASNRSHRTPAELLTSRDCFANRRNGSVLFCFESRWGRLRSLSPPLALARIASPAGEWASAFRGLASPPTPPGTEDIVHRCLE